jgi:hypothetical protein
LLRHPIGRPLRSVYRSVTLSRNPGLQPLAVFEDMAFKSNGTGPIHQTLLACQNGILLYEGETLKRILRGNYYGLSFFNERWHAFQRTARAFGQIVSFHLVDQHACDLRIEVPWLDPEVHQIDSCDGCLYVTDTARNRLLCFSTLGKRLRRTRSIYPLGHAWKGRQSRNYGHLNSVLTDGESTLVVLHNDTLYTGKQSELLCLDGSLKVVARLGLQASCAHNAGFIDGALAYCDSIGRALAVGARRLDLDCFTRGLVIADDHLLVGGTVLLKDRDRRSQSNAYVYCCDRAGSAIRWKTEIFESGSIYEVRLASARDLGQSRWVQEAVQAGHEPIINLLRHHDGKSRTRELAESVSG